MRALLLSVALSTTTVFAADPLSELSSFSIFDKVDLAQLARSDARTGHGPPMNNARFLSVQSVFVTSGSPAQNLDRLRKWNPAQQGDAKVFLHGDLSLAPNESAFAKIKGAPDNAAVRGFVNATSTMANELQLSKDEAAMWKGGNAALSGAGGDFWMSVLAGRARVFAGGGTSALPPYDHSGSAVRAGDELNGLLREQSKIRKQFSGLLEGTGIGRGAGGKPDLYWELTNTDNVAVATLGAFYGRSSGGTTQAADTFYYASGGYYAALTLYQMWPVDVNGQASTLIWRGDMVSSAALAELHGVEKLGSESAMMKDVARTVIRFRKDSGR
jgi:hypothetical protein